MLAAIYKTAEQDHHHMDDQIGKVNAADAALGKTFEAADKTADAAARKAL